MEQAKGYYYDLRKVVVSLGVLDCLLALSIRAGQSSYVRPIIRSETEEIVDSSISIKQGRHPIVETFVGSNSFVPNDTDLVGQQRCIMLTGPNMGGKSCYMKQVALIVLLAQIGSFVPAQSAEISPVDRIMVRMGAQDSMEQGKSTFFLEMHETAEILRHATARSLVLIDELGRGTSTHDGVAIADATLRYLLDRSKCFTLFVTHYHLLCQTASQYPRESTCYHMGFFENEGEDAGLDEFAITFLYQLTKGMASQSFGLNVARLARIPESVIHRAAEMSHSLALSMHLVDTSSANDNQNTILNTLQSHRLGQTDQVETLDALSRIWRILSPVLQKQ